MKEFSIEVKETLSRVINVEAKTIEEAIDIVSKQYDNQEIKLDYDDYKGYAILPYEEN